MESYQNKETGDLLTGLPKEMFAESGFDAMADLDFFFTPMGEDSYVRIKDSRFTDAAAFKTAVTGQTLVYELATPIEYQLDPLDVRTLRGVNNIFADTGDTDATVRADPDLHINKLIAEAVALALENA